ncbi:S-adenosylmethionine:tRNA ribosyltransferase-isomerase [Campylobacterota bacterium]|nr:S-adenosylmethionine:tRNA ribosyltransferase-isomerase [Campylobacterota bacterium]
MRDLVDFIPDNYALIFNNSRVIKARLLGAKASGGKIELLIIREVKNGVLTQIKGKVHIGSRLIFDANLSAEVIEISQNGDRIARFFHGDQEIDFSRLIDIAEAIGFTPLPPYIKRAAESKDISRYQSCFALVSGSVAAPTASLHFDRNLLEKIRLRNSWAEITLHIGLGTFKGVETADIRDHKMHSEYFNISDRAAQIISGNKPILAIGTTVCRVVENYIRTGEIKGECDLFLRTDNPPRRVNALMTNFHLPRSTLFILFASLVGIKTAKELYAEAIAEKYRFYSYGDAMLIL